VNAVQGMSFGMIAEGASLLAVSTVCAVTGWAVVYLAAKFQNPNQR
jgi:hypothetical protein